MKTVVRNPTLTWELKKTLLKWPLETDSKRNPKKNNKNPINPDVALWKNQTGIKTDIN